MILEILHLCVSLAEKILSQPDIKQPISEKDLDILAEMPVFIEGVATRIPSDINEQLKYPNSAIKNAIKFYYNLMYQYAEYVKIVQEREFINNKEKDDLLTAALLLETYMQHIAGVMKMWDSLEQEYIDYLQKRIDDIRAAYDALFLKIRANQYKIDELEKQKDLCVQKLTSEFNKLNNLIEKDVEKMTNTLNDIIVNYNHTFEENNRELQQLLHESEIVYNKAKEDLSRISHADPNYIRFSNIVNEKEKEINSFKQVIMTTEKHIEENKALQLEIQTIKENISQINEQISNTPNIEEKIKLQDQQAALTLLLFDKTQQIRDLGHQLSHSYENYLPDIPAVANIIDKTKKAITKGDNEIQQSEPAMLERKGQIILSQQSIKNLLKQHSKLDKEQQNLKSERQEFQNEAGKLAIETDKLNNDIDLLKKQGIKPEHSFNRKP